MSIDDFEVSIFLTETSTHHALLTKQKTLSDQPRLKSTSRKLTSWANTSNNPIQVDDDQPPQVLVEEDADEVSMDNIPEAPSALGKRNRIEDSIFVQSDDEEEGEDDFQIQEPPSKRKRVMDAAENDTTDDKKKLGIKTAYEGFSIYGRILCLIVKRRGVKKPTAGGATSGSQMLENWVSTQAQNEAIPDEDDG